MHVLFFLFRFYTVGIVVDPNTIQLFPPESNVSFSKLLDPKGILSQNTLILLSLTES